MLYVSDRRLLILATEAQKLRDEVRQLRLILSENGLGLPEIGQVVVSTSQMGLVTVESRI